MPLYEYQCLPNQHRFEARHGINEQIETCTVCGGPVRRIIHPVGIVFKGSGFYVTDSRKSSAAGTSSGSKSGEKSATEAKPEPKKETPSPSGGDTAAAS